MAIATAVTVAVGGASIVVGAVAALLIHPVFGVRLVPDEPRGVMAAAAAGLTLWVVGLFRRAADAERPLRARGYSCCAACGYPFDEKTPDATDLRCPECGREFVAGEAREWLRMHPERYWK